MRQEVVGLNPNHGTRASSQVSYILTNNTLGPGETFTRYCRRPDPAVRTQLVMMLRVPRPRC